MGSTTHEAIELAAQEVVAIRCSLEALFNGIEWDVGHDQVPDQVLAQLDALEVRVRALIAETPAPTGLARTNAALAAAYAMSPRDELEHLDEVVRAVKADPQCCEWPCGCVACLPFRDLLSRA